MVEAAPPAPFIITKAEFLLELLIIALDAPPQLCQVDQTIEGDILRQGGEPILDRPIKYWFSTLPEDIAFDRLVDLAKLRWRIERDYQELKQELGLGDYEGRGWRGFHHHATLCIAAYGFLIAERGAIPPSGPGFSTPLSGSAIPEGYQPRGAADPTRTPHPEL